MEAALRVAKKETLYRVDTTERYIVPNVLDKLELETVEPWPEQTPPSRQQIARLATTAPNHKISGDIEDVANAYIHLKGERTAYPLEVNDNQSNYNRAFPYAWNLKKPWHSEEWGRHVVRLYCRVSSGSTRNGIWFLNAYPPKGTQSPRISLTIRKEAIASDRKKQTLPDFLDKKVGQSVLLFWYGLPPKQGRDCEILGAARPSNACFAVRDLPPKSHG